MSTDNCQQGAVGNTKTTARGCNWFLTHNYDNDFSGKQVFDRLAVFMTGNCKTAIMQFEIGENGNKHIQGAMVFAHARTFNSLHEKFPGTHFEKARNVNAALEYCRKDITKNGVRFEIGIRSKVEDPLEGLKLYPWQEFIIELYDTKPDKRHIYWFWEKQGNAGKTSLAKHLVLKHPKNVLYLSGKSQDIKHCVSEFQSVHENDLRMAIFDYTRSNENHISYEALESLKNGILFSSKYESKQVIFNTPHIVCFANYLPEVHRLSQDRWKIVEIEQLRVP